MIWSFSQMAEKKNFSKELRMQLLGGYGKSDCEIEQTTSWPDGLDEASRFTPYLRKPVRRTDSVDDIERYYRYFSLARKNQGNRFTWKSYCDILLADLLNYDALVALKKLSIQPSKSKGSNMPPVLLTSELSTEKTVGKRAQRKRSFLEVDNARSSEDVRFLAPSKSVAKFSDQPPASPVPSNVPTPRSVGRVSSLRGFFDNRMSSKKRSYVDIESASSSDDVRFQTPSKNVLKKMCTEIRTLAQKTCEKISSTPHTKHCSSGDDVIRSTAAAHEKCSRQRTGKSDCKKPFTQSVLRSACKNQPVTFESPSIKQDFFDPRTKKFQRKPLFKPYS